MNYTLLSNQPEGRRVAYKLEGATDGLPLVLLHGFCEDHSIWDPSLPHLHAIRLLRLDIPGFGHSDLPEAPSMHVYADAVRAVLDDLSIEQCVLVGHSMGGYIALEFAEKHPHRLAGLGLFHSHPFEDSAEGKKARLRGIEMLQSGKRDLYVAQLFPGLFAKAFAAAHPVLIQALIEKGKLHSPEGIGAALEGMMARKNHLETLRRLECPAMFLLGSEDAIASPEQVLKAAVLPKIADVHVLPGVGHMAMFEAPQKSAEIVRWFWEFCAIK
jgi:pimeloyl-ACP methyl ester carboxylesterase